MKANLLEAEIAVGILVVGGLAFWLYKRGAGGVAQDISSGAVSAAGGAVTGTVGEVGHQFGLPTPADTTTDPAESRWIIDRFGYFEASKWSSVTALFRASFLPEGSGNAPNPQSTLGRYLSTIPVATASSLSLYDF